MAGEDVSDEDHQERHVPTHSVRVVPATVTRPRLFSGESSDPFVFHFWLNHVKVFVNSLQSVEERIIGLYQSTTGEAKGVVEPFLFEPKTQVTLDSAFYTLQETYGSETLLAEAYLESVDGFPQIEEQDTWALRAFVNLLKKGASMAKSCPSLDGFHSRVYLRTLIQKLPRSLRKCCVKRIVREDPLKPFGFKELLTVLEDRLKVLSHPCCTPHSPN